MREAKIVVVRYEDQEFWGKPVLVRVPPKTERGRWKVVRVALDASGCAVVARSVFDLELKVADLAGLCGKWRIVDQFKGRPPAQNLSAVGGGSAGLLASSEQGKAVVVDGATMKSLNDDAKHTKRVLRSGDLPSGWRL